MPTIAIRCHPGPSRSTTELGTWLEEAVERLMAETPRTTTSLSRLTGSSPSAAGHVGWLIELTPADAQTPVGWGRLVGVLRDMQLLGMRPTVLTMANGLESPAAAIGAPALPLPTGGDDGLAA